MSMGIEMESFSPRMMPPGAPPCRLTITTLASLPTLGRCSAQASVELQAIVLSTWAAERRTTHRAEHVCRTRPSSCFLRLESSSRSSLSNARSTALPRLMVMVLEKVNVYAYFVDTWKEIVDDSSSFSSSCTGNDISR